MNKKGFVLSTYVYMLLVFFLLLLGTMLVVLNNTKLLSLKLKEGTQESSGLIDKDFSFILLGDKEEIIRVDEEYTDKGFEVKTVKGVDLSEYVVTEGEVDTTRIGNYEIEYTVTYNGKTKELSRMVHVVDNVGVNYLNTLYEYKKDENGLIIDNTEDENLRYAGSNEDVKNYVEFGNTGELWRIIGVFDTSNGTSTNARMKLVRDEVFKNQDGSIIGMFWDSSPVNQNNGWGINQWGATDSYEGADIMRLLNGYYLETNDPSVSTENKSSCVYCDNATQGTCDITTSCSNIIPLNLASINIIDNIVWELGAPTLMEKITLLDMYNNERKTQNGKICDETNSFCSDTIERTTNWSGRIGLIYPSDYGYASINTDCSNNIYGPDSTCKINNWLALSSGTYWTISPVAMSIASDRAWFVDAVINIYSSNNAYGVRPSVYLKPSVRIVSGTGTSTDPYKLSL